MSKLDESPACRACVGWGVWISRESPPRRLFAITRNEASTGRMSEATKVAGGDPHAAKCPDCGSEPPASLKR